MLEMNKVLLIGNLTQDPDIRSLTSGTPLAEFGLAVNRRYKDKNGERKEETLFIQVECWGRLAEFCRDWLKKGRRVFVEGPLRLDSWTGKDGTKHSKIKIKADRVQFADARPQAEAGEETTPQKKEAYTSDSAEPGITEPDLEQPPSTDDDLPF
jgi:single-strand DNA-binding protein